jgi:hypothetical protein
MNSAADPQPPASDDENATGLPLLRSWRAVYWFVLVVFALYVALLTALSRVFS